MEPTTVQKILNSIKLIPDKEQAVKASQKIEEYLDSLIEIESQLESVIYKHRSKLSETGPKPVVLSDLVDYARFISKYTSGPPPTNPNMVAYPPIPQDSHMRQSRLFKPPPQQILVQEKSQDAYSQDTVTLINPFELLSKETDAEKKEEDLLDLDF